VDIAFLNPKIYFKNLNSGDFLTFDFSSFFGIKMERERVLRISNLRRMTHLGSIFFITPLILVIPYSSSLFVFQH
jgi:hypothetical protein